MALFIRRMLAVVVAGLCAGGFAQAHQFVSVSGKVTDQSGAPLSDVQVHLMQRRGNFQSHSTATSDSRGAFTLQLVEGGRGVVFSNGRDADRVVDYAVVSSPPQPVELKLKKTGRILRGTVFDDDGNPVPNALVGLAANTREDLGEGTPHVRLGMAGAGMMRLTTDTNGVFMTDKAPALPIIVWTAKPGDEKGLQQNFQFSGKAAVVDLKDGDVLDYRTRIDPPPSMQHTTRAGQKLKPEPGAEKILITVEPAE